MTEIEMQKELDEIAEEAQKELEKEGELSSQVTMEAILLNYFFHQEKGE